MKNYLKHFIVLLACSMAFPFIITAQLPSYVPPDNLKAFWTFSGNANDQSGNNIHGTVNGAALTNDRFGNPNSAYYFNGVNDWIDFGDNDLLNPHLHDMTVNAWVKTTSPYSRIFSKGTHGGTQPGYAIMLYPGTGGKGAVIFGPGAHEHNLTRSDAIINDNSWHMVTGVMDRDGRTYLYIDGVLQILWEDISHDATVDIAANTYNATAGASYCSWGYPGSLSEFFQGVIDEIGVWSKALEECEIQQLYSGINQYPVINCPSNQTRNTDIGFCSYTAVGNEFDATFVDDCPATVTMFNNLNGLNTLAGYEFLPGTTGIVWQLNDGNGLYAACSFEVTVVPTESPGNLSGGTIVCSSPNSTELVLTGYNGTISEWQYSTNGGGTWNSIAHTYDTLTVTNITQATLYRVKVDFPVCLTQFSTIASISLDYQLPIISCVPDRFMFTDTSVCGYTVKGSEFDAVFSDNCPGAFVINSYNGLNTLNGGVFPPGAINVQWYVYDSKGNMAACSFNVILEDNTPPTIIPPQDMTVSADTNTCFYTSGDIGIPVTSDNCDILSIVRDGPDFFPPGNTTITWTVTDVNGNSSNAQQTITVFDTSPPVPLVSNLPDIISNCPVTSLTAPLAYDNCAGEIQAFHNVSFPITGPGATIVTWTYDDGNGNIINQQQNVTVQNQKPLDIHDPIPTRIVERIADANTIVLDHFNNSTTGIPSGTLNYINGICGLSEAVAFSNNKWIRYGYNANLRDAATFDFWLYPKAYSTPLVNINWSNTATTYPGSGHVFHLDLNLNGNIVMSNWPGTGLGTLSSNSAIPLNQWTHVAVAWGDSTIVFVNGKIDNSSSGSFRPSASGNYSIRIPKWGTQNEIYIDEFHVSNKRRNKQEITAGYRFLDIMAESDSICENSSTMVYVINPQTGVSYQLYKNGSVYGSSQTGDCDTLSFSTGNLTSTASFSVEATNSSSCSMLLDTILTITILPVDEIIQYEDICSNNTFFWRGNSYNQSGIYYDTLTNQFGCDSIYILSLNVYPAFEFIENAEICSFQSFYWRGSNYTSQGTYHDSLFTQYGCDSVYILNLAHRVPVSEICNGIDDDCDGMVDEGVQNIYYTDNDGDGYGTGAPIFSCIQPQFTATNNTDCDDNDFTKHEGIVIYKDLDNDGYHVEPAITICMGDQIPPGYKLYTLGIDCNDQNPNIHPGATEICNGIDDDCDGQIDENLLGPLCAKQAGVCAGSRKSTCGGVAGWLECNNVEYEAHNSNYEIGEVTCDGLDNDCDGQIDEGVQNVYYADNDGDGYGAGTEILACSQPPGTSTNNFDCDDNDFTKHEGIMIYEDLDNDGYHVEPVLTICMGDQIPPGYKLYTLGIDCNDQNPNIHPGATEICNGIDDDCNGIVDDIIQVITYCGFGLCSSTGLRICVSGQVVNTCVTQWNEATPEICNGIDDNCDGQIDEGVQNVYYADNDGDGYGAGPEILACSQPPGTSTNNFDCDDTNHMVHPGAPEICGNNIDDNCNNQIDECYTLTVSKQGNGGGNVSTNPSGINCGPICSFAFPAGTIVTVQATPDAISDFSGWSGACVGTGSCQIEMNTNKQISATFTKKYFNVSVIKTGTGNGNVVSTPAGIDCGQNCNASFLAHEMINLHANPQPGSVFTGWGGDAATCGTSTVCQLNVISNMIITASFDCPLPEPAGMISGSDTVLAGQTAVTYTIPMINNATSYVWTLSQGITGMSNTNSISVDILPTATSESITVRGNNSCGNGGASILPIYVSLPPKHLQLKVFLEGLYNSQSQLNEAQNDYFQPQWGSGIADVITVELYESNQLYTPAFSKGGVPLNTYGYTEIIEMPQMQSAEYYIVIKHRNSIETWSAMPVSFSQTDTLLFDFTLSASQAYMNNMQSVSGGFFAIFGGDVNQDGIVDGSDMSLLDNAVNQFMTGYVEQDINGDGLIDGSDMALIDNNSTKFVHRKKP